ncbi:MAG: beta strand repeat-containing protein, partial [Planctomycetota bacterium]
DAGDGQVTLKAGDLYSLAIRHPGKTRAHDILLEGGDDGVVNVAGMLDASDAVAGHVGGTIAVLGDRVALTGAVLDASGDAGGGAVLIGGDAHGEGGLRTASGTFVSGDSRIHADALARGDGGKVVVWAGGATRSYGAISARGGVAAGDGGFVETSGRRYLEVSDAPDLSAPKGKGGAWLLDPANITIQNTLGSLDTKTPDFTADAASSSVSDDAIEAALNTGTNVTISTDVDLGAGNNESGDIVQEVDARIDKTAGTDATLSLFAANDIVLNGGVESTAGALSVVLVADDTTQAAHDPSPLAGSLEVNADIRTGGGSATLDASTAIDIDAEIDTAGGAATFGLNSAPGSQIRISSDITTAGGTLRLARNTILDGTGIQANQSLDAGTGKLRTSRTLTKTTAGDLALAGGAEIRLQGAVDVTQGSLTLNANSVEAAGLTASNNVAILGVPQGFSEVFGDVRAGADVDITMFANVSGSIIAGGDVTLEGVVTQSIRAGGDVDMDGIASVNGSLNAGNDVLINSVTIILGDVVAGNDVEVNEEFVVGGDINAENDVWINSLTTITGSVIAGNDIEVDEELAVGRNIDAGNDVWISSLTTISGNLIAGGDILLEDELELGGDIIAGNDVVVDTLIEIGGNVVAGNDVEVNDEFAVGGDVDAENDVLIGSFTTIMGNVIAGGDVQVDDELDVEGNIDAGNDVWISSLTTISGDLIAGRDVLLEDE